MVSYIMSQITVGRDGDSLNPCCSGRWSRTNLALRQVSMGAAVLILVVVEDGLVPANGSANMNLRNVLILVVVEDGLVHLQGMR